MPLYEYECGTCGHRFEVIQKFSDAPIERCRKCNEPVHKLISAPAIQFKGTGWYVTDYASKRNTEAAADKKASTSTTSSSDSSKTASDSSKTSSTSSSSDSGQASSSSSSSDVSKSSTSSESTSPKTSSTPSKSE